jgi:RecA/RadA recombinase
MAEKKQITFNDLNKFMSKTSKYGGLVSDGTISTITDYISTGNYMLNACLTGSIFKGVPNNRSTSLSGDPSTGKTFLMLNICREAQKQGYSVIWFDSENAVDFEQFVNFGINTKEVRYEPVQTIQEFRTKMTSMLDYLIEEKDKGAEIPKLLVCLDSAGNLPTAKEIEDAKSNSDKSDMTRAKLMRSIFRICMAKLGILNSTLIFTNHVYDSQDMFGGKIQSGGKGSVYGASIILNLSKGKLKEEGNVQTGIRVFAMPNKNRFCIPTPIEFNISYIRGMNPYIGLEKYVSWENCGADRGKFITEKEYEKMKDAEKNACKKVTCADGTVKYFLRSDSGRYICTDSGEAFGIKELWSDKVFTDERLHRIDEIIKKELAYSKSSDEELEELVDDADDDDEDLTEE